MSTPPGTTVREAFAIAWRTGNDDEIHGTAMALILQAGEAVPQMDPAEHPLPRVCVIRHEGRIRAAALRIFDAGREPD